MSSNADIEALRDVKVFFFDVYGTVLDWRSGVAHELQARDPFDGVSGHEHYSRRELSPFTTPLPHQLAILEAQLDVAVEMRRNVSCHSVKSQQATVDLLIKMKTKHGRAAWEAISVDLHSCGLSAQSWSDVEVRS